MDLIWVPLRCILVCVTYVYIIIIKIENLQKVDAIIGGMIVIIHIILKIIAHIK